jgi:hypothetical protein
VPAKAFIPGELDAQHGLAEFASVKAKAARTFKGWFMFAAFSAPRLDRIKGAWRRKRQTATGAKRSGPGLQILPADAADAAPRITGQLTLAKRALGGKSDGKDSVQKSLHDGWVARRRV